MRPQHITAENHQVSRGRSARPDRFNEAAAYHCGKPATAQRSAAPPTTLQ